MQRGTDGIVRMIGWRVGDPPRTSEHILHMDPTLDLERRRLLISAALTGQTRRRLGSSLAANVSVGEFLDLACGVSEGAGTIERAYRLRFDPPYPGSRPDPRASGGPPGSSSRVASAIGSELLLVWSLPRSSPVALPRCRWRLLERAFPQVGGRRATFTKTPRHSTHVADGPTTILRDPSSD